MEPDRAIGGNCLQLIFYVALSCLQGLWIRLIQILRPSSGGCRLIQKFPGKPGQTKTITINPYYRQAALRASSVLVSWKHEKETPCLCPCWIFWRKNISLWGIQRLHLRTCRVVWQEEKWALRLSSDSSTKFIKRSLEPKHRGEWLVKEMEQRMGQK